MITRSVGFALSLVVAFLCSSPVGAQAVATKQSAPKIEAIDRAIQEFVDQGLISGAVTLVGNRGKVIHHGAVGLREIEGEKPMQPWTGFSIASMTKPITATAVMILQEEGKLNVDDPLSKYLPEFADVKLQDGQSPSRELTIRDAITHTSGIV